MPPSTSPSSVPPSSGVTCTNCGATGPGEFCSECGQNRRHYQRALHRVVWDALSETFDLDSRLLASLVPLLFRPGFLSREFAAGRRARYVSPTRLYLVASLVFFFLLSVQSDTRIELNSEELPGEARAELEEAVAGARAALAEIETEAESKSEIEVALEAKAAEIMRDPRRAWGALLENLPLTMFVMLPLFAALLKALYPRHFYAEHLVFALHLHSFLFIAFTLMLFVPETGAFWGFVDGALSLACWVYAFAALKVAYSQSLTAAALKSAVLVAVYTLATGITLAAMALVTIWLF